MTPTTLLENENKQKVNRIESTVPAVPVGDNGNGKGH